jgi:hypothetical protein
VEEIFVSYKGYVLNHLKVPLVPGQYVVSIASENPALLEKIGMKTNVVVSPASYESAISQAKRFIDIALAGQK